MATEAKYAHSVFDVCRFSILTSMSECACNMPVPYMTIMLCVCLIMDLLGVLLKVFSITSACIYIISEQHLPLGSDWPHAGEYGECAS